MDPNELTPEVLLNGYNTGIFPMAVPEMGNDIYWFAPDPRAIIPLDQFHISKSLHRTLRKNRFEVVTDRDFMATIVACSLPREDDGGTWISDKIIEVYHQLYEQGFAHTIECYLDDELVGGLYGIALGGAFFGESMFHRETDASKVALSYLVNHMKENNFVLLDVQYITSHLKSLGAIEISRKAYEKKLAAALKVETQWPAQLSKTT